MRLLILIAIVVSAAFAVVGQPPRPTPTPPPPPQSTPPPQPARVPRMTDLRLQTPFPLNNVSESDRLASRVVLLQRFVAPIYRKPTSRELAAVLPSQNILQKYSPFLAQPNTGVFKLLPDTGCANNERVISAKEDCIKYSMPGAANSFSFRTESYRIRHLADITLEGGDLRVTGIFMHAMMANIGDVPIEEVSMTSPGVKGLISFVPSTKAEGVMEIDTQYQKGVENAGFRYLKQTAAEPNATYAFRVVAYRGKVVRSSHGVPYNELDYDKRKDVIVAFRIVEKGEGGSVTIVWKQLAEAEAPKIRFPKAKPDGDDEENE